MSSLTAKISRFQAQELGHVHNPTTLGVMHPDSKLDASQVFRPLTHPHTTQVSGREFENHRLRILEAPSTSPFNFNDKRIGVASTLASRQLFQHFSPSD